MTKIPLMRIIKSVALNRLEKELSKEDVKEVLSVIEDLMDIDIDDYDNLDEDELKEEIEHLLCTEFKDLGKPVETVIDPFEEDTVIVEDDAPLDLDDDFE